MNASVFKFSAFSICIVGDDKWVNRLLYHYRLLFFSGPVIESELCVNGVLDSVWKGGGMV